MEDLFDIHKLKQEPDFEQQLNLLLRNIRLTRDEVQKLRLLFKDLQETLHYLWPGCQVMPFGSIITGLGIKTSDVDCYVHLPNCEDPGAPYIVIKARNFLRRRHMLFKELFAITTARVPIVKFLHAPTGRNCDVNFKTSSGVRNSKLIAYLLHIDSRAVPFAVLIKYWAKVHNLTGTNLMPNYAMTMLTIFYLQQKDIIPSVQAIQENKEEFIDNWNTGFDNTYRHETSNTENLYQLVGGFFNYYSQFNFGEDVVSPYLGYPMKRAFFNDPECLPEEYKLYKFNVSTEISKPLTVKPETAMCIQDPFEHNRNCAAMVYPKLAGKIVSYFKTAAKRFTECENKHYLMCLLNKDTYAGCVVASKKKPGLNVHMKPQHTSKKMKHNIHNHINRIKKGYK